MKKFLALLLVLVTALPIAAAAEDDIHKKSEYILSLGEAINLAMTDNPQFITYDTKIEDSKVQLQQAKYDVLNSKGPIPLPAGFNIVLLRKNYYVNQAQNTLTGAQMEKTQAEKKLEYDVTEKYYNVKMAEELLKTSQTAYELMQTNYNTVKTQLELGMAAELDERNANLALMQAKSTLDGYERSLETARDALRIALQIENEDAFITLTDTISCDDFAADLKKDILSAQETRYDLFQLKNNYNQSLVYLEAASTLGEKSTQFSSANLAVRQCDYYYTNSKRQISLLVKNAYNSVLSAKDNLDIATESRDLKNREYSVANLKYGLGLITNTELTNTLNALASADIALENAKLKYKLASIKYGYEITIGL